MSKNQAFMMNLKSTRNRIFGTGVKKKNYGTFRDSLTFAPRIKALTTFIMTLWRNSSRAGQAPDQARRKTDAQNQSQCACLIEKDLEMFIFVLCYLNKTCSLHFVVIPSKVFAMKLLQCECCLNV